MRKEYEEGYQSYFTLRGAYQNLYSVGSQEHNQFEAGWKQATGLYPNILREYLNRKNIEDRLAKEEKAREARRTAEAYRNRKGR